jgi:hypothetical protein
LVCFFALVALALVNFVPFELAVLLFFSLMAYPPFLKKVAFMESQRFIQQDIFNLRRA